LGPLRKGGKGADKPVVFIAVSEDIKEGEEGEEGAKVNIIDL